MRGEKPGLRPSSLADQSAFDARPSDSKPKALSAPVHFTSVPRWALAPVFSLLIFPLVWSHGQCETVLKENLKFFFHFKHSIIDHAALPWPTAYMPYNPCVCHEDCLWLRNQGWSLDLEAETVHRCSGPVSFSPSGIWFERHSGQFDGES